MKYLLILLLTLFLNAQEPDAILESAVGMARSGNLDKARDSLIEGLRRFPRDARFSLELAGVSYRQRNFSAAKSYLRLSLSQEPEDAYANEFLGSLYLMDGNVPAALKYWNRVGKPLLGAVQFVPDPALDPVLRARISAASAGQVLTMERYERTEGNLRSLGIFAEWQWRLTPEDSGRFGLQIYARPKTPPLRGWYGPLVMTARGLAYREVHFDRYNLHRRAINLTSLWRWDPEKRRIAIDISGPAAGWRWHWTVDARDEIWDLPGVEGLRLRKVETGADLERDLSTRLRWTVGVRVAARRYPGAPPVQAFSSGWTARIRNRFDSLLYRSPEHRFKVDAWAELGTGQLLSQERSRLITPEAGLRGRWLPQAEGDRYELIAELRTGAVFGNAPLDEWFLLGMERDNDLWLRGHVGTRHGRKGYAPMGTSYLLARTELNRKVLALPFARLYAGPFFDNGSAGGPRWLCDAGLQVKVFTFGGLGVTVVYGRSLREGRGAFYTAVTR